MIVRVWDSFNKGITFEFPNGDMYLGKDGLLYLFPKEASYTHRIVETWELYLLAARGIDKDVLQRMIDCIAA